MVRRDRNRQYVRGYHNRPRRDDSGRHGNRRRRQHKPEWSFDVRADRRIGPKVHGSERHQSDCSDRGGPDDAGAPWRGRGRRADRQRRKKGGVKRSEEPFGGPHGLLDNRGGRLGSELYNSIIAMISPDVLFVLYGLGF